MCAATASTAEPRRLVRAYPLVPGAYAGFAVETRLSFVGSNARANYFSRDRGTSVTHEHMIRVAPPLVITSDQVDWALDRFGATLRQDFS